MAYETPARETPAGWSYAGGQKPNGLRDKEIVEVSNDALGLHVGFRGEQNFIPWSEWAFWRRPQGFTNVELREHLEAVDHPKHYNAHPSGIECIDVVRHMNFNLGNVVKYVWRAGEKDPTKHLQDLKKAAWYLNDEIEKLSK